MTTVSIGIPVYNGERFLDASLDSLLGQTYEDIEFVVSDNGSTDGTEEICRDRVARDPRLRYLRSPVNRGAAWNYANVVRETSGSYFKWATHDDLVAPTYVERCMEVFAEAPESVGVVYARTAIIDEIGDAKREYHDNLDIRDPKPWLRLRRLVGNIVMSNASFGVIRRSVLERSRLLGAFPSADYAMMAEFALLGEIWEIPEVLFFRREHAAMSRAANPSASEAAEWFLRDRRGDGRCSSRGASSSSTSARSISCRSRGRRERSAMRCWCRRGSIATARRWRSSRSASTTRAAGDRTGAIPDAGRRHPGRQ